MLLAITTAVRETGRMRLRVNYTINPDNLDELSSFWSVYGAYDIGTLQLRPVFDFGDTAYTNKRLLPHVDLYRRVVASLMAECRARGVRVLANISDPAHEAENLAAYVYEKAFLRFVNPERVWLDGFDWRRETLSDFARRIRWRAALAREILHPAPAPAEPAQAAAFDVF